MFPFFVYYERRCYETCMHRFLCRRLFSVFLGIDLELKPVRFHFHFIPSTQKAWLPLLSWEDSRSCLPLAKGDTWPHCDQSYEYDTQARPLRVLLLRLYSCSWRSSCSSDVSGLEEGGWDLWHWLPPHGKGLSALGESRGRLSRDGLDLQSEDSSASSSHPKVLAPRLSPLPSKSMRCPHQTHVLKPPLQFLAVSGCVAGKRGLCSPVQNRNTETELWRVDLSLCQAKEATAGQCSQDCAPVPGKQEGVL